MIRIGAPDYAMTSPMPMHTKASRQCWLHAWSLSATHFAVAMGLIDFIFFLLLSRSFASRRAPRALSSPLRLRLLHDYLSHIEWATRPYTPGSRKRAVIFPFDDSIAARPAFLPRVRFYGRFRRAGHILPYAIIKAYRRISPDT